MDANLDVTHLSRSLVLASVVSTNFMVVMALQDIFTAIVVSMMPPQGTSMVMVVSMMAPRRASMVMVVSGPARLGERD